MMGTQNTKGSAPVPTMELPYCTTSSNEFHAAMREMARNNPEPKPFDHGSQQGADMENESNLGQPIPTAILTPTEIITPPDATTGAAQMQPALEPALTDSYKQPMHLVAEMMLAPMHFWAAVST